MEKLVKMVLELMGKMELMAKMVWMGKTGRMVWMVRTARTVRQIPHNNQEINLKP